MARIKALEDALYAIEDAIPRMSDALFKEIGAYVVNRIRQKALTGKTMASDAEASLKPLSESYVEYRKKLQKSKKAIGNSKTDPDFFSPKRSNLTLTGQYLKAIQLTNVDKANGLITIASVGTRDGGKLTNEKLSGYLTAQGRSIWGLDAVGKKVITQKVIAELRRNLRSTKK